MSVRKIAEETGVGRDTVQALCRAAAQEIMEATPSDLKFEHRFWQARAARLEGISEELADIEREMAALVKQRKPFEGDADGTPTYVRITLAIDELRSRASQLRSEHAGVTAMPPPREILEAEVEAARRAMVGEHPGEKQ